MPAVAELPHCAGHQAGQVAHDESRMLAGNFDLTGKGEIIAHKHGGTYDQPGGKPFVVRVPQAEHVGVITLLVAIGDLEQAKVTSPVGAHAVGLGDDPHIRAVQCALHLGDERLVGDGAPSVISVRRANVD